MSLLSRTRRQGRAPQHNANTPTAIPTFAPVLIPLSLLFRSVLSEGDSIDVGVSSDVEEEVAEAVSDDGITVMTVYVADEVEGVAPSDSAVVWLHCPLPLESVQQTWSKSQQS